MIELRVTVQSVRETRLCTRGMRTWLEAHGFDVADFVRHGLPVETLEATGDAYALHVCAHVRKQAEAGDYGRE